MKAVLLSSWNNLEMTTLEKPTTLPGKAVLRMLYAGVCGSDITVYSGQHMTAKVPVVLCHEILGIIEELPPEYIGDLKKGDRVVVNPVIPCGECVACLMGAENVCQNLKLLGIHENGGFAEYIRADVARLFLPDAVLPDNIAALCEPFAVSRHVVSRALIKENDKVLVIGAGTIGLTVALAALELGAQTIVSEINAERLSIAEQLGLCTFNPAEPADIIAFSQEQTGGTGFDVVIDASGSKSAVLQMPDLARPRGVLVSMGLAGRPYEFIIGKVSFKEQTLIGTRLYSQKDFAAGIELVSLLHKKINLSLMISDVMPLKNTVEAVEMMRNGKNRGKILIECGRAD